MTSPTPEGPRPKRIQRQRTKGWRMPPNTVDHLHAICDRIGRWRDDDTDECIECMSDVEELIHEALRLAQAVKRQVGIPDSET